MPCVFTGVTNNCLWLMSLRTSLHSAPRQSLEESLPWLSLSSPRCGWVVDEQKERKGNANLKKQYYVLLKSHSDETSASIWISVSGCGTWILSDHPFLVCSSTGCSGFLVKELKSTLCSRTVSLVVKDLYLQSYSPDSLGYCSCPVTSFQKN